MQKSTFSPQYDILKTKLVAMRKAAGLTQRQLAKKLNREHSFVSRIELGERRLDVVEFYWVCLACDKDPKSVYDELLKEFAKLD
jgi:transcriptional regulator with XRE-family HTH domain